MLRQVLKDKEKEISDAKDRLRQVKEGATREYRVSDVYLTELRGIYVDGFNDCLRQVKTSFPDLDFSHVSIDTPVQASVQPIHSKSSNELFTDDALVDDPYGDGETAPVDSQIKSIDDSTH